MAIFQPCPSSPMMQSAGMRASVKKDSVNPYSPLTSVTGVIVLTDGNLATGQLREVAAVDNQLAAGRALDQTDQAEHRAFTGAARTY